MITQLKNYIPLFLLILATCGCKEEGVVSVPATIKVYLKDEDSRSLSNKYLYLYDHGLDKIIDSAAIKNRSARFVLNSDSTLLARRGSVKILDTFQGRQYYRPIGFRHPFVPKVSIHIFFIDTGTTFIETYTSKFHPLNSTTLFSGSVQNIPYFKDVYLRYPDSAISDRKGIIDANTIKIQRWPNSYFLLGQLFTYRNYFTREELEPQLARFSDVVKKSAKFLLLTQSSSNKNNFDNTYPAGIKLLTPSGEFRTMGRSTASASLIVFWASWCGPCRKEIPLLKKLYAQHKGNGFEIMSISMDANQANWHIALRQEEMPWAQFLLTDSSREFVTVNYELSAIPKSYLFDKNGILVERFLGLEDTIKMYKALKEVLK